MMNFIFEINFILIFFIVIITKIKCLITLDFDEFNVLDLLNYIFIINKIIKVSLPV